MKVAVEQLSNDTTIIYLSLHFLETFPIEDPLRPEALHLLSVGNAALAQHLRALQEQVNKYRSQCQCTPYARVKMNYLGVSDPLFSLDKERVLDMPPRELVLFLINELQSNVREPSNYADCHAFDHGILLRLRQLYQMTAPIRRRKANPAPNST